MLVACQTNQQVEQDRKLDYLRGINDRLPAAEWRWLLTPLRECLVGFGPWLISEGIGSIWRGC